MEQSIQVADVNCCHLDAFILAAFLAVPDWFEC